MLIIRTSDRNQFRKCRELWNFKSKIRLNWEYVPGIEPLDFGIAIHAAMEVLYDPLRWHGDRKIVEQEAVLAFMNHLNEWRERLKRSQKWDLQKERWEELVELGKGMLANYFAWYPERDARDGWIPVKSEIEFEVPIPVPEGETPPPGFRKNAEGNLEMLVDITTNGEGVWAAVVYQGRVDLVVQDAKTGLYWIVDHKTAAQFGQTEHLDLDVQCGSYYWALRKLLGLPIAGVIYQEMRKDIPHPPALLKSGALSKNKSQRTTVEMYEQAIKDHGLNRADYADFLPVLAANQTEYFRRLEVGRNPSELEVLGRTIYLTALDMLEEPRIYPNPDRWNCNGCVFRTPCLIKQEGGDWEWHLKHSGLYEKMTS